jgi:predicted metal-dependent enzyme (double-stranded beta helix superfamily)
MSDRNWLVTNDGRCIPLEIDASTPTWQDAPYRLYRFLTDVEDIILQESDDRLRLQKICPLVRRLLNSSEWILTSFSCPDAAAGWAVETLYDEPDFPLTVQNVVWSPQQRSSVHNHATWGIVALLDGRECNRFWNRAPTPELPDRIEPTGSHIIEPGDIVCLMPAAIHQIEAIDPEPTISFNMYGITDYDRRFEFDLDRHTATNF